GTGAGLLGARPRGVGRGVVDDGGRPRRALVHREGLAWSGRGGAVELTVVLESGGEAARRQRRVGVGVGHRSVGGQVLAAGRGARVVGTRAVGFYCVGPRSPGGYGLSLHDALPILGTGAGLLGARPRGVGRGVVDDGGRPRRALVHREGLAWSGRGGVVAVTAVVVGEGVAATRQTRLGGVVAHRSVGGQVLGAGRCPRVVVTRAI